MKILSLSHILYFFVTVALTVVLCAVIRKVPRKWQNVIFAAIAVLGCAGIFFRHAMGLTVGGELDMKNLLLQQLQVCNFNFILMPLMLIPKNEMARQYSCMFSMFAAFTTFLSIPARFATLEWYDVSIMSFWFNHLMAILLPVLMIAARRLKPQKKYVLPVSGCVFGYFTLAYLIQIPLVQNGIVELDKTFSYVMRTDGIPVFDFLRSIIDVDYFYLYPLLPLLAVIILGFTWLFRNYKTVDYWEK